MPPAQNSAARTIPIIGAGNRSADAGCAECGHDHPGKKAAPAAADGDRNQSKDEEQHSVVGVLRRRQALREV